MLSDWELWACANLYVSKHGDDAPIIAAFRADELMNEGEFDGAQNYRAIVRRITELLAKPNCTLH